SFLRHLGRCRRDLAPRSRGGAVNRGVSCRAAWWRNAVLLRRPGDWAIGRAVRRSMHKLVAANIEMTGYDAFSAPPVVCFIEPEVFETVKSDEADCFCSSKKRWIDTSARQGPLITRDKL